MCDQIVQMQLKVHTYAHVHIHAHIQSYKHVHTHTHTHTHNTHTTHAYIHTHTSVLSCYLLPNTGCASGIVVRPLFQRLSNYLLHYCYHSTGNIFAINEAVV